MVKCWSFEKYHPRAAKLGEERLKIRDVVSDKGWDWAKISMVLPMPIKLDIQAIPYAIATSRPDKLA